MKAPILSLVIVVAAAALASSGCETRSSPEEKSASKPSVLIAAPMSRSLDPVAIAVELKIEVRKPEHPKGLHNVFRLSPNIISGGEPEGIRGLDSIRDLGAKTIISVDGKAPDFEGAEARGMTYVHIPITYRGIDDGHARRLIKAYRELPGPFYIHCYHGKHRGPAAAALGRLALDGASRPQVLAEMNQWAGTSKGYRGLYEVVANYEIPSPAETEALKDDLTGAERLAEYPSVMVLVSRADGALTSLSSRNFAADPDHPDLDAHHEAQNLLAAFEQSKKVGDFASREADFQTWTDESIGLTSRLISELDSLRGGDPDAAPRATATYKKIRENCASCHKAYRDN